MIYIKIPASQKVTANNWVTENADPLDGNTFVVNKKDEQGNEFCLISLPNNESGFNQQLVEHFGETPIEELEGLSDISTGLP